MFPAYSAFITFQLVKKSSHEFTIKTTHTITQQGRKEGTMKKEFEPGYIKGEICNREGCIGLIDEHYSDECCSCHINPPCSYCTTSREYCPTCGWDAETEQHNEYLESTKNNYKGFGSKAMHDAYYEQRAKQEILDKEFNDAYSGVTNIDRVIIRYEGHTHFSMIKKGVFPKGTETRESLLENHKISGTFGGRFESFTDHSFKYIAYTD